MSRPLRAEVSLEIDRPVREVFAALCEAEAWPTWTRWASSVRVDPPGPIRGGSVVAVGRRGVGLQRESVWNVTDLRPDRLIALEHDGDGRRMWLQLEPSGEGTLVTARVEVRAGRVLRFLRRRGEERALRADLRRLRVMLGTAGGIGALVPTRPAWLDGDAPASLEAARRSR